MGQNLLLIEVDKSAKNNAESFNHYREHADKILTEMNLGAATPYLTALQIGFCKVGNERHPHELLATYGLDVVAYFEAAAPTLVWAGSL